jgi:hypothetical protein
MTTCTVCGHQIPMDELQEHTVVVNTHDRQRCDAFGDVERLSELDTFLVGEGAPSEAFADS